MKIRKVEIQAFRAYDEVKDCTFDFTRENGDCADFVSLYAPNGFGKTSFYDAVEWGVTNNIYRFTRQDVNKNYAQDEKHLKYELDNKKTPHYILRNKNSPKDRLSYVKLHLDGIEVPKERELKPASRIDSSDYHFDEKTTEKSYFRDVILSQDHIDAFLREDDPTIRYTKFMTFFGDKELDRLYTNIMCLIRMNDQQIKRIQDDIENLEDAQPKELDNQVLEKVNERISPLTALGEKLPLLTADFSDADFIAFSDLISDRLISLAKALEAAKEKLDELQAEELSVEEIDLLRRKIQSDEQRLKGLQGLQKDFQELSRLNNQMAALVLSINKAGADQKQAEEILRQFPVYRTAVDRISEQTQEMDVQKKQIINREEEINKLSRALADAKALLDQYNGSLFELLQKQESIPQIGQSLDDAEKENLRITGEMAQLVRDIDEINRSILAFTATQKAMEDQLQLIGRNDFTRIGGAEQPGIAAQLKLIQETNELLTSLNVDLRLVEQAITNHESLNNELKQLISLASGYINKSQSPDCPVCLHTYESQEELEQRIMNNPLLNPAIQARINEKNVLNLSINEAIERVAAAKAQLLKIKNAELQVTKTALGVDQQKLGQLAIRRDQLNLQLRNSEARVKELFVRIEGMAIADYLEKITGQIAGLQKNIETESGRADKLTKDIVELKTFIESWKKTMGVIENGIRAYRLSDEYINVGEFIRRNRFTEQVSEQLLTGLISQHKERLAQLDKEEKDLREKIHQLTASLSDFNELKLTEDLKALELALADYRRRVSQFDRFIREQLEAGFKAEDSGRIKEIFEKVRKELETTIAQNQALDEVYKKIDGLKNNVLPFLKYKQNEQAIASLKGELLVQQSMVDEALQNEKGRISNFIDTQVESFFYEELINQLYRKIDPHPEYKKIKFKCDFNGDKPKLNVFVVDHEDAYIIPNLYFSTAQMNILSLSIFLAKALNARDDQGVPINCIFIDDPIQSLDSINILSTIDLIRSIVLNFEKQVILSTHDENFFFLLQKKMPADLFNAKYLELETFGKVKPDQPLASI
jgi:exonuclease SbcC